MQEEACRHTLSALHTMLRHAVHRALFGAHSTIVCLTPARAPWINSNASSTIQLYTLFYDNDTAVQIKKNFKKRYILTGIMCRGVRA